ncbi:MAG: cytochrome c biogenesis protein CcdA [Endomicrobiaceae bacterium]|nr:cytochrome c biogenesis protein CcdA [Endomicrobiaceae bacterium]
MIESLGNIPIAASFFAGILTFISPCILPLIPAYITFITGLALETLDDKKNTKQILINSLIFVSGFSLIFILLGLTATFIGSFLLTNLNVLKYIGGSIIIIFGLHLCGIFKIPFLYKQASVLHIVNKKISYLTSFFVGCAFAFAWTPCVGPILSSILILASTQGQIKDGALLLSFYSLGLAIPFILTALFINKFLVFFNKIKKYYHYIEIFCGILLILIGIMIMSDSFNKITGFLLQI